jgi:hypothetical protein
MKCPSCGGNVNLIPPAERNVETYNRYGSVLATSQCCGVAFNVSMEQKFNYKIYTGNNTEDDWGNKIKKYENISA